MQPSGSQPRLHVGMTKRMFKALTSQTNYTRLSRKRTHYRHFLKVSSPPGNSNVQARLRISPTPLISEASEELVGEVPMSSEVAPLSSQHRKRAGGRGAAGDTESLSSSWLSIGGGGRGGVA